MVYKPTYNWGAPSCGWWIGKVNCGFITPWVLPGWFRKKETLCCSQKVGSQKRPDFPRKHRFEPVNAGIWNQTDPVSGRTSVCLTMCLQFYQICTLFSARLQLNDVFWLVFFVGCIRMMSSVISGVYPRKIKLANMVLRCQDKHQPGGHTILGGCLFPLLMVKI